MPTGDSGADQAEIPVPKSTQPVTKPPNRKLQPATRRTQKVWLSVSSVPISEGSRAPSGLLDGVVLGTWGIAALSPRLTSRSPLGTHGFGGGLRRKAKWSAHLLSGRAKGPEPYQPGPAAQVAGLNHFRRAEGPSHRSCTDRPCSAEEIGVSITWAAGAEGCLRRVAKRSGHLSS